MEKLATIGAGAGVKGEGQGHRKGQGSAGELTTMVVSGPALRSAPI